jgi:glutamine synthetase
VGNVLEKANEHRVEMVQLMFTDLHGTLQQLTITSNYLTESLFESGVYFDGSSIRGWQPIEASDMIIKPDVSTVFIDPFAACPTIAFLCDVYDPETKQNYHKDPRHVARKAVQRCKKSGICDHVRIGPECEFYVFDNVSYSCGETNEAFYTVDSNEGSWTTGRRDSKGYKPRIKEGYFPGKPFDTLVDLRSEMVQEMNKLGLHVECAHHEVGAGGQCEIDFRFDEVIPTGDKVILYKYVVRNVAFRRGKTVTFMPKPLYGDNGSGMHQHYSLHDKDGKNLFTGEEYAGLSQLALYFIGGIMKHADALCAITNPTTNSYKRLVPGYEAPIYEAYSSRNRSAFIRVPTSHPKGRRIEYRTPDPCCNPYLSFAAIIQAGLDGIENKISPGEPTDKNLYHMNKQEMLDIGIKHVPSSLRESIDALIKDNDFLKNDNVFTDDLIQTWIESKEEEITNSGCFPTPYEYHQYFDA